MLRLEQKGWHFQDEILKYIFLDEKILYFDWNITEVCSQGSKRQSVRPPSMHIMAWHQTGTKPVSKPMLTKMIDVICCD